MKTIGRLATLSLLFSFSAAASGLGCAVEAPGEKAAGETEDHLDRTGRSTPVVVVRVDAATRAWIASERSTIDGAAVGEGFLRQREMFLRLQRAIDDKQLNPLLVHYGYYFTHQDAERPITEALADALDDSPVPVVLEVDSTASGTPDRSIYHAWSLVDPPRMLVGQALMFSCSDAACRTATLSMDSPNPALDGLPVVLRAALEMGSGKRPSRKAAVKAATGSIGERLPVDTTSRGFRTVRLRDVLTTPAVAASLDGAAVIVAPDTLIPRTELSLDVLKGATMAAVVAVP